MGGIAHARIFLRTICLSAALLLTAADARAHIFGRDDRVEANADGLRHLQTQSLVGTKITEQGPQITISGIHTTGPVRDAGPGLAHAIGIVQPLEPVPMANGHLSAPEMQSTGFLISPCHVATAFHAVFGNAAVRNGMSAVGRPLDDHRVVFRLQTPKGEEVATGKPVAWGNYLGIGFGDAAIVELDRCLGADPSIGYLYVAPLYSLWERAVDSLPLATIGYYEDRPLDIKYLDPDCRVRLRPSGEYRHDCANLRGASGGPIFYMYGNMPIVVAIHSGQDGDGVTWPIPWTGEHYNVADQSLSLLVTQVPAVQTAQALLDHRLQRLREAQEPVGERASH
ncbi:MAG: hypothetical protein ABW184_16410 [Sphingobium sp.]